MDSAATFIAKYLIVVPVIVILYLLYVTPQRRRFILLLVCGGILSIILAKIASRLYWDPRPFIKDGVKPLFTASRDNGFPSDHALLSSFLAFCAYLYSKKAGYALFIIAVLISWARVFAGVHHAVDVVASFILAAVSLAVINWLLNTYYKPPKKPAKHL